MQQKVLNAGFLFLGFMNNPESLSFKLKQNNFIYIFYIKVSSNWITFIYIMNLNSFARTFSNTLASLWLI